MTRYLVLDKVTKLLRDAKSSELADPNFRVFIKNPEDEMVTIGGTCYDVESGESVSVDFSVPVSEIAELRHAQ